MSRAARSRPSATLEAARRALPQQPLAQRHDLCRRTPRTPVPVGPARLDQVLTAGIFIGEPAGRVLAALDHEYGLSSLKAYLQTTADNDRDVAAGNPLTERILALAETGLQRLTPAALLHKVMLFRECSPNERRGWSTAQEMSQTLTRLSPSLRLLGVTVVRGRSNGNRYIDISGRASGSSRSELRNCADGVCCL